MTQGPTGPKGPTAPLRLQEFTRAMIARRRHLEAERQELRRAASNAHRKSVAYAILALASAGIAVALLVHGLGH